MQAIQASYIFHKDEQRIRLEFENYGSLNKLIKSIPGARWSKTYQSRQMPCDTTLYNSFKGNLPVDCKLTEVKENDKAVSLQIQTSRPSVTKGISIKTIPANRKVVTDNKIKRTTLHSG